MQRPLAFLHRHGWWLASSLAVAVAVGVGVGRIVGYPAVWVAYALFNAAGVWLSVDRSGFTPRSPGDWMAWCAIALLPVGAYGLLIRSGGTSPREYASSPSADDAIRKASARIGTGADVPPTV